MLIVRYMLRLSSSARDYSEKISIYSTLVGILNFKKVEIGEEVDMYM